MRKKTIYTDAPQKIESSLRKSKEINDFLPPPDKLIRKQLKTKITITLNTETVSRFKTYAKKHNAKYQTMINDVLESYSKNFGVN